MKAGFYSASIFYLQELESGELESFRETLKSAQKKLTRKCARKFVRFCDEDGNKKVSDREWVDCMGITSECSFFFLTPET